MNIDRAAHDAKCGYAKWYDSQARWQPIGSLSDLVREIMVEEDCTCAKHNREGQQ